MAEVLDLLERVERELPVQGWSLEGVRVWPLLRLDLTWALDAFIVGARPTPARGDLAAKLRTGARLLRALPARVRAALEDREHESRAARPADAVFLTMSSARRFKHRARWYCSFSDPIIDRLEQAGRTWHVLEYDETGLARLPRHRPSQRLHARIEALHWLRPFDRGAAGTLARLPGFARLAELVREASGAPLPDPVACAKRVAMLLRLARLFGRRIERLAPAVGLTFGWYGVEGMAFGLACARRGVPVVDVQHGLQGPLHPAYTRWRLPPEGYELLPDLFWTWSEADAQRIASWAAASRRHRSVAVGNLLVDAVLRDPGLPDGEPLPAPASLEVLVALSAPALPELVEAAIAASPREWRWWVRVHPAQLATVPEVERRLALLVSEGRRVEVRLASEASLYTLLARTHVVLTEVSSAIVEAAHFGKRAVLCHPLGAEHFADRVAAGKAALATGSGAEVVDALRAMARPDAASETPFHRDGFASFLRLFERAWNPARHGGEGGRRT